MNTSMNIEIGSTVRQVSMACVTLKALCAHFNLPKLFAYQIELSLDEILINVVEHDLNYEADHKIGIHLEFGAENLLIQIDYVSNQSRLGSWKERREAPDVQSLPERGFGCFLVQKIMDEVRYERIENRNHFTLSKSMPENWKETLDSSLSREALI